MWIVTTSEVANSSSLSTGVTPTERASSGSRCRLQAATSIPNACPTAATGLPIPPSPTMPSRRPFRSAPTVSCHPPSRSRRSSAGTWRTAARISAHVISTVAALSWTPPVPDTVIPARCAAATSIAAFAGPVVTSRRRFGSRSEHLGGEGGALAHDDERVEGLERGDDVVGPAEVLVERRDLRAEAVGDAVPLGALPGHLLVVVQDRDPADLGHGG